MEPQQIAHESRYFLGRFPLGFSIKTYSFMMEGFTVKSLAHLVSQPQLVWISIRVTFTISITISITITLTLTLL